MNHFRKTAGDLPLAHFLESWGDARTPDGTLVPVQPLIEPLFGGMTEIELLGRIAGLAEQPVQIVRDTFRPWAAAMKRLGSGFSTTGS